GARADEPRGGHDEPLGKMSGEPGHEVPAAAEGGRDLSRIAGEVAGEQGLRGEASAADRRTDALAGDVPGEAGRVPNEGEARAAHDPGPIARDGVGVAAEGRQLEPRG